MAGAPQSLEQQDEGTLLEFSLRRAVRRQAPSAWARAPFVPLANSLLPFSVGWTWQRFPEAAKVVNPVAQQLLDTLASRHGVHIRFVQATLCKRDGTKKSVDCVAFLGGNGRAGGERCWLELRWTRDLLDSGALSVQGAWSVVDGYGQILNELSEWKLDKRLGGGRVFRPLRLGVLLVNRTSYRLELAGAPTHVFCGALTEARSTVVQHSSVAASVMATAVGLANVGEHRPLGKRKTTARASCLGFFNKEQAGPKTVESNGQWVQQCACKPGATKCAHTEELRDKVEHHLGAVAGVSPEENTFQRKSFELVGLLGWPIMVEIHGAVGCAVRQADGRTHQV